MPVARFQMPDGRVARFEVPEGTTPEQAQTMMAQSFSTQPPPSERPTSFMGDFKQGAGNAAAGLVRGAGSIGATILAPYDMAKDAIGGKGWSLESNRQRRADMDGGLQMMGAEPDSMLYKGGKLAGEIAGTMGAGGALVNGTRMTAAIGGRALPAGLDPLLSAISSAGMSTGARAAPGLAGMASNVATRAAGGAINGGISAGMVDPNEAATGALIGGALPPAMKAAGVAGRFVGGAMGKAVTGGAVSPEVAALAKRAKEMGIDIPADRLVSSKPLDAVASALNYMPFSGRAATEAKMGTQLNQALSNTFGENSSNVTQALRQAEGKLGGQFDTFLKSNTVRVDNQFLNDLADASSQAGRELGGDQAGIIAKQVDEILSKAGSNQEIDGQAAYNIKKTLDRIGNRNSPESWYALDLKKKLMDALNRSVGTEQAQEFGQLRQHYGNMLDLQKLAKNGVDGEVSVARLANMKNIRNQPMQELADIASQFVRPRESQHGAMQRAVAGGLGFAAGGLPGLLGGAAVGRGMNGLLNSGAMNQLLLNGKPPMQGLLANPDLLQFGYRSAPLLGVGQ